MGRWSARSLVLAVLGGAALLILGVGTASALEAAGGGWYWQNPLVQGNTFRDVAVRGTRAVAVGDSGAVYVSTDGGATWRKRASGTRVRLNAVDFVSSTRGWAAGNGRIVATTDGGSSWTTQATSDYNLTDISFFDGQNGWVCGSYSRIGGRTWCFVGRTTDGGGTWDVVKQWTSNGSKDLVQKLMNIDFASASVGWATGWGYDAAAGDWGYMVLKTTDGGVNWTISRFGDGRAAITALNFTSVTDGWLATESLADYAPATIWKTSDGGTTWTAMTTKDGATVTSLSASASGECYASGRTEGEDDWVGFILHSTDGGATWQQEYSHEVLNPIAVDFSSSAAVAVGSGGLYLVRDSSTGGWNQVAQGVRNCLMNVQFRSASKGWAVGWKSTVLYTTDGGKTWKSGDVPKGISLEGIDMVTDKIGWAVGCSGPHVPYADQTAGYGTVIIKTTDGGKNWAFQRDRTSSPGLAAVDFVNSKNGWAVGSNGVVLRTKDGGKHWLGRTTGTDTLRDVRFSDKSNGVAVGGETGSVSASGVIKCTTDGGVTWKAATADRKPSAPLRSIQVPESGLGDFLVFGDDDQLYKGSGVESWAYSDMTPNTVYQDPPFRRIFDGGMAMAPTRWGNEPYQVDGWALSDGGTMWEHLENSSQDWFTGEVTPAPESTTVLSNHTGGSGAENELYGLAIVNQANAWVVGQNGTILSFDRNPPVTSLSPSTGWLKTPLLTLQPADAKSGVAWTRWTVDPTGTDWQSWTWYDGTTATFDVTGDAPGTQHVIWYQSLDNVGNLEVDPFWLEQSGTSYWELPRHIVVTVDTIGPKTYAPVAASVVQGKKPLLTFWVDDDLSPKAKVSVVVKNGSGATVKTVTIGWVSTGQQYSAPTASWKCTLAKGTYTFSVRAVDQAGNQQVVAGENKLTVK